MLILHGCSRCGGTLYEDADPAFSEKVWYCLTCGGAMYGENDRAQRATALPVKDVNMAHPGARKY